jgi:hypothetical protein
VIIGRDARFLEPTARPLEVIGGSGVTPSCCPASVHGIRS